ncbi:helix-turn-helix domain-containing protein [Aeromonas jandaei]
MKSETNQATPTRLTRREAAAYLGLSEKTLGVWASNGRYELPYYKLGNRTLYERADLDAFLAARKMLHTGKPAIQFSNL